MINRNLTAALLCGAAAFMPLADASAYTLDLSTGAFPKDVTVENLNGLQPNVAGYKRGYTLDGWTVDRLGNRGMVAVSPTYTRSKEGEAGRQSHNVLTLPYLDIEPGYMLRWDALSLHPDFLEAYEVRIQAEGDAESTLLYEEKEAASQWEAHLLSLKAYEGKKVQISFHCLSSDKYLLALDAISVDAPQGFDLKVTSLPDVYYSKQDVGDMPLPVEITVANYGAAIAAGTFQLECSYEIVAETVLQQPLLPGESLTLKMDAPLRYNKRTPYVLYFKASDSGEAVTLYEGSMYMSDYVKRLFVDKATGMWCNNCPDGTLALQEVQRQFGDNVIAVESHNNDLLANEPYITELKARSLPTLELDRIRESASSTASMFSNFYYTPVNFGVEIVGVTLEGNDRVSVTAAVETSEEIDNADDRYRVGFLLAADFYNPDAKYYQYNNCTMANREQYYYLPSVIPAPLVKFHNVTLTCETAFSGIEESLPAVIIPGVCRAVTWTCDRPELLDNLSHGRVIALVIDTQTGHIVNSAIHGLDEGSSDVESVTSEAADGVATVSKHGEVALNLADGTAFTVEAVDMAGAVAARIAGVHYAGDSHSLSLAPGIYAVILRTADNACVQKVIITE